MKLEQSGVKYSLILTRDPTAGGKTVPELSKSEITPGEPVEIRAIATDGYRFTEWTIDTGKVTFTNADESATTVTLLSNATVIANFVRTFTVSFNTSGGAPGAISPVTVDMGATLGDSFPVNPTRTGGYAFGGWYDTEETSPQPYTKETVITKNVTLTALWIMRCGVAFNLDGGRGDNGAEVIKAVTVDVGTTLGANFPVNPTKAGYTFDGWYDDGDVQYTAITSITKNVMLTAKWTKVEVPQYMVTFRNNMVTRTVMVDGGKTIGSDFPTSGSWYDGSTQYTASTIITKSVTLARKESISDARDGQTYLTVNIGSQTWMAENLNYRPDSISNWCYDNHAENCAISGRLYTWAAAMEGCPSGWRLPMRKEWDTLVANVGEDAGKKLKSASGWGSSFDPRGGNGTDDYGFSAIPGGNRLPDEDTFYDNLFFGFWWSTTPVEHYPTDAFALYMSTEEGKVYHVMEGGYKKSYGFSVRCIEDKK